MLEWNQREHTLKYISNLGSETREQSKHNFRDCGMRIAIIATNCPETEGLLANKISHPTEFSLEPVLRYFAIGACGVDIAQGRYLGWSSEPTPPSRSR